MTAETKAPRGRPRKPKADGPAAEPKALEPEVLPAEGEAEPTEAAEPDGPSEAELAAEAEPESKASEALSKLPAVSARDPLARYMSEVGRHPLLTREQEHELAVKYQQTGDVDAAYKLVASNLRLVVKIAFEYHRTAFNILDLVQEGNIGLMQAVKKFDPYRGIKLSTYAAWWIRAYILRYIMDNWRMVKLGTTQAQRKLFFNLKKEKERLLAQGFDPGPKLLAERLDVSEQDVIDMDRRLSQDEFSLDTPVSEDDSRTTFQDRLASTGAGVDDRLGEAELAAKFREGLAAFAQTITDEKERFIFEKRLTAEEPLKLQEIGDHFGVSRERARQIEAKLTARLKTFMKERIPDFKELSFERED